jgi:mono/diheme cytochrome c family protein
MERLSGAGNPACSRLSGGFFELGASLCAQPEPAEIAPAESRRQPGLAAPQRRMVTGIMKRAAFAVAIVLGLAAQTTRSVWDGVYSEDQSKRGGALYAKECASCHGTELTGGESAPALVGDGFLSNWNGTTVGDLFERIRKSMPQDDPGRLSRQQDADILAFVLNANRFPVGKAELERETEVLKLIKIEASK